MNQTETTYPYSAGDLLEKPNTYFYTGYQGKSFLYAWRQSRTAGMAEDMERLPPSQQQIGFPEKVSTDYVEDRIDTMDVLTAIQKNQDEEWCQRLAKKFEVSKRLYDFYRKTPPYRPYADASYKNLDIYLLFAEQLVRCYRNDQKIQWLNVILKIMDTLISQRQLMTVSQRVQLNWLIEQEQVCLHPFFERVIP